jgi:hypothetical protein
MSVPTADTRMALEDAVEHLRDELLPLIRDASALVAPHAAGVRAHVVRVHRGPRPAHVVRVIVEVTEETDHADPEVPYLDSALRHRIDLCASRQVTGRHRPDAVACSCGYLRDHPSRGDRP